MLSPMRLAEHFDRVTECWSPKVVCRVNDQYLKVAKIKGSLAWHKHDAEDELFLVVRGRLTIELKEGPVTLESGDCYVVPRGVLHNPVAQEECWIVLIETVSTKHTGDVIVPQTRTIEEQLE